MSLVQKLYDNNLDVIGDVHGEYTALLNLLKSLGYDEEGNHPQGRKLVFVGDLCDRGPDSPAVIKLVKKFVDNGNAQAVLGNHELNILQGKPKDGTGWYVTARTAKDKNYEPFAMVDEADRQMIYDFLASLPLALERDDLRVVHAAWVPQKVNEVRSIELGTAATAYQDMELAINKHIATSGLLGRYHSEQNQWEKEQEDPQGVLPYLEATSEYNLIHQMGNPMRVLTSGVEQRCDNPFYASGKWRYVERFPWWNAYNDDVPVIVGHFWRKILCEPSNSVEVDVFDGVDAFAWHGAKHNVFCVDYSVGGRFKERNAGIEPGENTKLVAMRWPERELVLETGEVIPTVSPKKNFKHM